MCSAPVIICRECSYMPVQRRLVEDDYMIEAFAPYGSDHALDVGSVPRGPRCTKHLLYAHVVDLSGEVVAEDSIPISQQIAWCRVPGESIAKLLGSPIQAVAHSGNSINIARSIKFRQCRNSPWTSQEKLCW